MGPINYLTNEIMIPFLTFSYNSIYPNYGVSILLLTLVIKLLFYPLTKKQFESMKITQKIQPKMKKIQEKFKGQPEKIHQEVMKLWKENNANPLGGCLPALVQLPVFFAIFYTVKSPVFISIVKAPGINHGLFPFWLADLTLKDSTYILPALVAISMYLSQKMMVVDESQKTLMTVMPIVMFVVSISMPAGVLLYWAASQLISTLQQYLILNPIGKSKTIVVKENEA
jgi:YidC/Oxa1 family membrane protein insertase